MAKIMFVQPTLSGIGSIQKILPIICKGLTEHNHEIVTASFYDSKEYQPTWSEFHQSIGEVVSTGIVNKIFKIIRRCWFLVQYLRQTNPDLIIVSTHGSSLIVLFLRALFFIRIPVIVYVHQALSASDKGYSLGTSLLYRLADGYVCVSKGVANEVRLKINNKNIPIVVAYNPLPISQLSTTNSVIASTTHPVLISAARLEYIRGVDLLVNFCCRYFAKAPGELWLLGEGALRSELEKVVQDRSMADRIHFLGEVSDVESYLKQADIYTSLARFEALGVSLIEALASGVPVICTDAPYGPREVLEVDTGESLSYPFKTTYGHLVRPVTRNINDIEMMYQDFEKGVIFHATNPKYFSPSVLEQRAGYFSTANAISPINTIINAVTTSIS